METKFNIGDHVLLSFEVVKIFINDRGEINYSLTADYHPYTDIVEAVEEDILAIKKELEE